MSFLIYSTAMQTKGPASLDLNFKLFEIRSLLVWILECSNGYFLGYIRQILVFSIYLPTNFENPYLNTLKYS
jgi:hypothetical protein